jgi:uncharacterized protein YqeY
MRDEISSYMKNALKAGDKVALSTTRLIIAALKDRDITARGNGVSEGISDDDILSMLQTMIKQRRESSIMYRDAGRTELAETEEKEIKIIQEFLPEQLGDDQIITALETAISQTSAVSVKDMGKVMAYLKQEYTGKMDFSKISARVKTVLMDLSKDG